MSRPRYWRVWEDGYRAGTEAATDALRQHLEKGGEIAVMPFSRDIAIKHRSGFIATVTNLIALAAWHPREPGSPNK